MNLLREPENLSSLIYSKPNFAHGEAPRRRPITTTTTKKPTATTQNIKLKPPTQLPDETYENIQGYSFFFFRITHVPVNYPTWGKMVWEKKILGDKYLPREKSTSKTWAEVVFEKMNILGEKYHPRENQLPNTTKSSLELVKHHLHVSTITST